MTNSVKESCATVTLSDYVVEVVGFEPTSVSLRTIDNNHYTILQFVLPEGLEPSPNLAQNQVCYITPEKQLKNPVQNRLNRVSIFKTIQFLINPFG